MADIHIVRAHALGLERARKLAFRWAEVADKKLDMTPMTKALAERAKAVISIGKLGPELARQTREAGGKSVHESGDLASAVTRAKEIATSGDVVLLSTGCASYDQFTNFEQRGDLFAKLAKT